MIVLHRLKEALFSSREERITRRLQEQPLMREHWLAEDYALEQIFTQVHDPALDKRITELSTQNFNGRLQDKKIPCGHEEAYQRLCLCNARRMVWEFSFGLQDELAGTYAPLWEEEMRRLGKFDEFQRLYVSGGKSRLVTTMPDRPYF